MSKQVFQTDNKFRWYSFKWSFRVILFVAALLFAALIIMLIIDRSPSIPFRQDFKSVIIADKPFLHETKISKEYKGFRAFFNEKKIHTDLEKRKQAKLDRSNALPFTTKDSLRNKVFRNWKRFPAGIRSAFYVAWDPQSLFSLKRNILNLNLVIPEWFFIDNKADTVKISMDPEGYKFMRKSGVPIMPMLSNNFDREFRAEGINRILKSPEKRKKVIDQVLRECIKQNFVGINLDLEALNLKNDAPLVQFVKEFSEAFHAKGLLVTQDIMPFTTDYDFAKLAKYNDYLFLMAYNEFTPDSEPGAISSQRWIEAAVDKCADKVPPHKIILGLGAYGYDWPADPNRDPSVTYQQALARANASGAKLIYDNDTYNVHYAYKDQGSGVVHNVYFTDAATHFNTMRFAVEYGLGGVALWRLGSEDNRLWRFYLNDLSKKEIKKFNFKDFEIVRKTNDVDYVGGGEVLNVLYTPHTGKITTQIDTSVMLIAEENYVKIPSTYEVEKYGEAPQNHLVLTFDDGPDETYTPQIIDVLSKYHVPGVFFVIGMNAEKNLPILKRLYDEGFEIGNHTFTHMNVAKISEERTRLELKLTRLLIESVTGHSTILFRAPFNADSEPSTMEEIIPVALAREENYLDIGENIDPEDWQVGVTADSIFARVKRDVENKRGNIILLHDAGGLTRAETVKALPLIIEYFQKRGYVFTDLTTILHKKRDELMPPVPRGSEYYIIQFNLVLATIVYWLSNFFSALFIVFIILGFARLIFMVLLAARERFSMRKRKFAPIDSANAPLVSIIVPAYNEEVNAVSSLANLLKQDYSNFNVIFVDDGSKDETYKRVCEAFDGNEKLTILTKPNGGKASALNYGIAHTSADYLLCIDADTKLYPDVLTLMMRHFLDPNSDQRIGAIAGNVKVGNEINVLTKWQSIEYVTSQNFDRMAYANINAITVVPGAIGAFKKEAIVAAGGFTTDTLAEDCDLTMRIIRNGYIIENENKAVAVTEAPEHVQQFVKQRTRWTFGVMQSFWKHRDTLFRKGYKGLGFWAMPNILIFQFLIPFFSPLADLFMIGGMMLGNAHKIILYYFLFLLIDSSVSIAAFFFEKEKPWKLIWIIPQRFGYRWIMYVVLFKSLKKALKGELQSWGILKRTGNVGDI